MTGRKVPSRWRISGSKFVWIVFHFIRHVRKPEKWLLASSCLSVLPLSAAWNNWASLGRIYMKLDIWVFFENLSRKLKFHWNITNIMGTRHEDLCRFMIISHWILLIMTDVSEKIVKKIKTHILLSVTSFQKIVPCMGQWRNHLVKPHRPQMTIQNCVLTFHAGEVRLQKHSEYALLIAFQQQQRLTEGTSMLR